MSNSLFNKGVIEINGIIGLTTKMFLHLINIRLNVNINAFYLNIFSD